MDNEKHVEASQPKCGLLALLPKPKQQGPFKSKPASVMLPPTIQRNVSAAAAKETAPAKPLATLKQRASPPKLSLVDYGSSGSSSSGSEENDEEESSSDFFGIKSAKIPKLEHTLVSMPSVSSEHLHDVEFGPQKPADGDYGYPAMDAIHSDSPTTSGTITDNIASEMIYKKELAPFGASSIAAREAVMNMIDVNVDRVLGPHVQENLLKNLNNKVMAQVSIGPLPKVKKDPKDRLSKRKHQITHLAGLAVAREEQLQEQWAENRQKKKASSKRYGF